MIEDFKSRAGLTPSVKMQHFMRSVDQVQEFQRTLQALGESGALFNSAKQIRDLMASIDTGRAMREAMAAVDAGKVLRDSLIGLNTGKAIQDAMGALDTSKIFQHLASTQDFFRDFHRSSTVLDFTKQMGEAANVFRHLQQGPLLEVSRGLDTFKLVQDQIQAAVLTSRQPFPGAAELLQSLSRTEWPAIYDLPKAKVELGANGTFAAGQGSVSIADVQAVVEGVFERAAAKSDQSADEHLRQLIKETKKLSQPLLQQIVFFVLLPIIALIIASILNPIADHYIKEYLAKDKRSLKKAIHVEVAQTLDRGTLTGYRLVVASSLHVRERPASKSAVVGALHFGQAVQLLERDKNWARVRWTNEDEAASIEGWVFARYLEKFK